MADPKGGAGGGGSGGGGGKGPGSGSVQQPPRTPSREGVVKGSVRGPSNVSNTVPPPPKKG